MDLTPRNSSPSSRSSSASRPPTGSVFPGLRHRNSIPSSNSIRPRVPRARPRTAGAPTPWTARQRPVSPPDTAAAPADTGGRSPRCVRPLSVPAPSSQRRSPARPSRCRRGCSLGQTRSRSSARSGRRPAWEVRRASDPRLVRLRQALRRPARGAVRRPPLLEPAPRQSFGRELPEARRMGRRRSGDRARPGPLPRRPRSWPLPDRERTESACPGRRSRREQGSSSPP